jgi:alkylhydroperoxidase family enzyme
VTPLERELLLLARKTCESPAGLRPSDLDSLNTVVPGSAVEYVVVAGAFHFVNRIADLLNVDPEALPEGLRRFEWLRKLGVSVAARLMKRLDLVNRRYDRRYEDVLEELRRACLRRSASAATTDVSSLRASPQAIEILRLTIAERDDHSSLDEATLARVHRVVENALPRSRDDIEGFHPRPQDPVEAFAFVGTRYPARTTPAMIERLRAAGYEDLGILDRAIAVADANQWARMYRLLDLDSRIFLLA